MLFAKLSAPLVSTALFLACTGCGSSPPTNFYVLDALAKQGTPASERNLRLGLGPLTLPAYLDRPQIVTRVDSTRLVLAEFDRWAEPLDESFQRVLAEDVSRLLGTNQIHTYPWSSALNPDRQVHIDVLQFDADPDGGAMLVARWMILGGEEGVLVPTTISEITVAGSSAEYSETARSMSQAIADLGAEISRALESTLATGGS